MSASCQLARAFTRMTDGHGIRWDWSVAEGAAIAPDPADLDEVAGNLMDSARVGADARPDHRAPLQVGRLRDATASAAACIAG